MDWLEVSLQDQQNDVMTFRGFLEGIFLVAESINWVAFVYCQMDIA